MPLAAPVGLKLDFDQLHIHASGNISEIYGEMFKVQDTHSRQVRMPEPPLLLADRVTGIDATPGSMEQKGTLWSETTVTPDRWYLSDGHVPAGILIESGQADLMLISYLGVDFLNKGERIYRLLGCELTYYGGLPKVGDLLSYDIHLDGHAAQGQTRLMFFHSDCRVDGEVRLSVRKGQAGFFTDAELANSEGCLWKPETQEIVQDARVDAPFVECTKSTFTKAEVRAFADGRPWECFGPGYEWTQTHTRTPKIQGGRMVFLEDIDAFEPNGGPWKRGYLKSTVNIDPDHWFFNGHFKNDPCMPGTLMFEGCLQAMAFYITGLGYTLERDGWRFEPVEGIPFQLVCRGQVTPQSKVLTYEVFVEEVISGPEPVLYADLLCIVDGLKAFHARRVGLKLKPSWPLDQGSPLLDGYVETKEVAKAGDFPFDYRSMLACANGRPSEAFGSIYDRFDSHIRVARLPNPPYHFLSRVTRLVGEIGSMKKGMEVDVEYDIPPDAFYFDENGCRTMPFAVLLEAALQPCGWLASYLGCALTADQELFFRNLDGTGTLHVDLLPDSGTLLTKVKSTNISKTGPMIIVSFDVECWAGDTLVYTMDTVFGFFPAEALANQVGLPTKDEQRVILNTPGDVIDLRARPAKYWRDDAPRLAEPMLLMLDRVAYFDPKGGPNGLGALRGEKDVVPAEWFFKAHFFQDPVQPGSLGIEAMIQLLQFYMLETGMDAGIENPRFETLSHKHPMTWKYRGQVIPRNKLISSTLEITEVGRDEDGAFAVGNASLWVDGKRIYEAFNLGMRIVSDKAGAEPTITLDPQVDTWVNDHCPTYTVPSLPMMSVVDLLAQAACKEEPVTRLKDVRVKGWVTLDHARTLQTKRRGAEIVLLDVTGDKAVEVATAKVETGNYRPRPVAFEPLSAEFVDQWGLEPKDAQHKRVGGELPYENGKLFHGAAFQALHSLVQTAEGATSLIHTALSVANPVPTGRVNPLVLDAATHGIPHDQLQQWDARYPADKVAYPAWVSEVEFFAPTPTRGLVRCEARADGFVGTADFPAFKIQLIDESGVWCQMRLVEACFPKGKVGLLDPVTRQHFLRDFGSSVRCGRAYDFGD
ncbi:MAG: polyketide synthase dehydratase domain-containing protein [bacterium]